MSHIKLSKALRIPNLLCNVFGTSPYHMNPNCPSDMVVCTTLSILTPLFVFFSCITAFSFGISLQNEVLDNNGTVITHTSGIDTREGSVYMIIIQFTVITAIVTYIMTNVITFLKRQGFVHCMVSLLKLCQVLDSKYGQKYNFQELSTRVWTILITLIVYYFFYVFVYGAFMLNSMDTFYLLPVAVMIESITSLLSAVDLICPMIILDNCFKMFGRVRRESMDEEYLAEFTSALDVFEMIGQNHGFREIFNIGNEFISILSQLFYMFYSVVQDGDLFVVLISVVGILPRAFKLFYISLCGSRVTQSVRTGC